MKALEERRKKLLARYPQWRNMTLYEGFAFKAAQCPDRVFFVVEGKYCTYAEVLKEADRISAALWSMGLREGGCAAVALSNRIEFVTVTFALAKIGAVKVPVNRNACPRELEFILGQTEAGFLITERPVDTGGADVCPGLRHIICLDGGGKRGGRNLSWEDFLEQGNGCGEQDENQKLDRLREPEIFRDADGVCDIIYTSGSTGRPKGVMLTHDMLWRSAFASCVNRGYERGRRIYVPLPLFHVYGYVEGLLAAVLAEGSILITRGKFQVEKALGAMELYGANDILSVPSIMMKILQHPSLDRYNLKELHGVYCSASICPKWVWKAIREKLGVREVITGYGMTEVSGASMQTAPDDDNAVLAGRVGKILYGGPAGDERLGGNVIEYKVIDENGGELPQGGCGQLLCRGPIVTLGYYRDEEATALCFDADGWLKTGDVGYFDENGYLKFLGRCNDMYKINGENVSPQYLDKIISKCGHVVTVETVGVPDEKLGWIGAAFVDAGCPDQETKDMIMEYCKENLAPYQMPRYFFFTDSSTWPHTTTGKVQKYKLRDMARKLMEEENGKV